MSLATNADLYRRAGDLLTKWGWGEYLHWYSGWTTRTNGSTIRTPSGVTVHHTGGTATATSYLVNPSDRPQLKVLANIHIDALERKIRFICAGSASHGGYTHEPCYDRVIAGTAPLDRDLVPGADSSTFSINTRTVGIEVDGAGGANEWNEWTLRATVATSAALHIAAGWPIRVAPRVGAHKEHTRRKPGDPYVNMGTFRKYVLDCLDEAWAPPGSVPPQVLGSRILSKAAGQDTGADVAELGKLLTARGLDVGTPADVFGPMMDAAVRVVQIAAGLPETGVVDAATLTAILGQPNPSLPDGGEGIPPVEVIEPDLAPDLEPVPEPEPVPVPMIPDVPFRIASYNIESERFGGGPYSEDATFVKKVLHPSILLGQEANEKARNVLREVVGYMVWPHNYVAVFWDPAKYSFGPKIPLSFNDLGVNGAVAVELTSKVNGQSFVACSVHVRPNAAIAGTSAQKLAGKKADVAKVIKLLAKYPNVVVGGDWNTYSARALLIAAGYHQVTPNVITHKTSKLDSIWERGALLDRTGGSVHSGPSDHMAVVANLTNPAPAPVPTH